MQILIDDERYNQLEREARDSGRSVAAIVREAIDLRFSTGQSQRADAGRRLMAEYSDREGREPDWASSKAALEDDLDVTTI